MRLEMIGLQYAVTGYPNSRHMRTVTAVTMNAGRCHVDPIVENSSKKNWRSGSAFVETHHDNEKDVTIPMH